MVSVFVIAIQELDCMSMPVHRVVFEFNYDVTTQNKSRKRFTVSGRSKQASKQANIHTHRCNEVTLVWGSLRLAPIMLWVGDYMLC